MSKLAANPAALPHLCLCRVFKVNRCQNPCNGGGERPSFLRVPGRSNDAAVVANFRSRDTDENSVPACVCRFVSRLLHGHCFGAYPAPCGSSLFCFGCAALRVTVSLQILFGKNAEKISPEPPQMQSFGTWEHGPLA